MAKSQLDKLLDYVDTENLRISGMYSVIQTKLYNVSLIQNVII